MFHVFFEQCFETKDGFEQHCRDNFYGVNDGSRCYFFADFNKSWYDGWAACERYGTVLAQPVHTWSEYYKVFLLARVIIRVLFLRKVQRRLIFRVEAMSNCSVCYCLWKTQKTRHHRSSDRQHCSIRTLQPWIRSWKSKTRGSIVGIRSMGAYTRISMNHLHDTSASAGMEMHGQKSLSWRL